MRFSITTPSYPLWAVTLLSGAALKARLGLDCPLHAITGLLCPACGATRAFVALAHGDPTLAVRDNVLFVAVTVLGVVLLVTPGFRGRTMVVIANQAWPTYVALGIMLVFAIIRNLPAASFLRPL